MRATSALLPLLVLIPLAASAQEPPPDDRPMAIPWWEVDENGQVQAPPPGPPPPPQVDPSYDPSYGPCPQPGCVPCPPPPPPPAAKPPPEKRRGPIDRRNKAAIGIRSGSLVGGYRGTDAESVYADMSLGLDARWRLGPIGFDVGLLHANQGWRPGTTRAQTMLSASGMLFFAPQRRLQPFFDVGLTANAYKLDDDVGVDGGTVWVTRKGVGVGPHFGLGLELALGRSLALAGELRVVNYLNLPRNDFPVATQLQATMGLLVHF